jgi:NADPH-dependent ferric siderophore reductase
MSTPDTAAAAPPRPVRVPRRVTVLDVERLTPHLTRIAFGGAALEGFGAGAFTDHYVKLLLPPPGAPYAEPFDVEDVRARLPREQWPRTRTYTVRDWDAEAGRLTIDFVVHGDSGVAGPWAAGAKVGDQLQLNGPGGAYAPDPAAAWHLMVGDTSVVPAIAASLARVPAGVPVHVLLEVDGPEDELPLETPGDLHLRWHHRRDRSAPDDEPLLDAVRALDFPSGRLHGFVHGEAATVRAVRRHLLAERGVPREALSVSGYWKRERTEEGWREDKAEWNRLAEEDVAGA